MELFKAIKNNVVGILFFVLVFALFITGLGQASAARQEEALKNLRHSINRAVVSCYAIEGMYPDSLAYLEENYSLVVDWDKYVVHYQIFSSNIMPVIDVLPKSTAPFGFLTGGEPR